MQNCIDNLPPGMGCSGEQNKKSEAGHGSNTQFVNLFPGNKGLLFQNKPNPFGGSTVINYFVPENAQKATMVFYDEYGSELQREVITTRGYGTMEINAATLVNGTYIYSLLIDGKTADTKKMSRIK